MIGDRIVLLKEHYSKAKIILPQIMDRYYCDKLIVTLGGESGTGKTEVACALQAELWNKYKKRVKLIHLDDFYFTNWLERNKKRRRYGIRSVGIQEINWKKLNQVVKTFKSRFRWLNIQRIHKYTNSMEDSVCLNNCIDILIIEGLYATSLKGSDLNIYLDGTYKDTKKFRLERNKEPQTSFREKVLVKEGNDILKTKKLADIIIPFKVRGK